MKPTIITKKNQKAIVKEIKELNNPEANLKTVTLTNRVAKPIEIKVLEVIKSNLLSLNKKSSKDNEIMTLLNIPEMRYFIANTTRGDLSLTLPHQGIDTDYWFTLDSVRVDKPTNDLLLQYFNGILYTL